MLLICLTPMLFSVLILAAHFLRSGPIILVLLCLIVPLTLFVRRIWAVRVVQLFLLLGAAEWLRTLIVLVRDRQAQGEPWLRLVIVLGTVAAFTAVAALILQARRVRDHYGGPHGASATRRRVDAVERSPHH
ncbi:MAG: hypothetical protein ACOYOS_05765 [Syntrophales bacterium]